MRSLRYSLFAILLLSVLCYGLASANVNHRVPRSPSKADQKNLQEIIDGVEHVDSYKEAVHQGVKPTAAAHQGSEVVNNLAAIGKRQDGGNGTVTSSTVVTTSSTTTVTVPITSTDTTTSPTSSTPTSSDSTLSSTPTSDTSTTPSPISTPSSSSSTPISSSTPTSIPSSTSNIPSSTSAPPTPTQFSSQLVTSFHIYATTSDGVLTTVTQTTVVLAGEPDQTPVGSGTKSAVAGSLQSNGASTESFGRNIVLGAVGAVVLGVL